MNILGIESSCDETAAAVVADGRFLRSSIVASQIPLHARFGGVVPEVASRQHVLSIVPTVQRALAEASTRWEDVEAVAVTYGPGLAGSLLVGINTGKAIALARRLPLVAVNHLEGHIYANWLIPPGASEPPPPQFPLLCLVVSGGHSDLVLMRDHGEYRRLGRTRDDAAGEVFDKVARILGLGYPGGPAIQQAAEGGDPHAFAFPRAWLHGSFDFSFSGLKTAVLRKVEELQAPRERSRGRRQSRTRPADLLIAAAADRLPIADLAASFQAAVVDVLVEKTRWAAERYNVRQVALAGGVAANLALRREMQTRLPVEVLIPPIAFCTDNAAIIASCGYFRFRKGIRSSLDLDAFPALRLT